MNTDAIEEILGQLHNTKAINTKEGIIKTLALNIKFEYVDIKFWADLISARLSEFNLAETNEILRTLAGYKFSYNSLYITLIQNIATHSITKFSEANAADLINNLYYLANLRFHDEETYFDHWKSYSDAIIQPQNLDSNSALRIIKALTKSQYKNDNLVMSLMTHQATNYKNQLTKLFYLSEYYLLIAGPEYKDALKNFIFSSIPTIPENQIQDISDKTKYCMIYEIFKNDPKQPFAEQFIRTISSAIMSNHLPQISFMHDIVYKYIRDELGIPVKKEDQLLGYTTSDLVITTSDGRKIVIEVDGYQSHRYLGKEIPTISSQVRNVLINQVAGKLIVLNEKEIVYNEFRPILYSELKACASTKLTEQKSNEEALKPTKSKKLKTKGKKYSEEEGDIDAILAELDQEGRKKESDQLTSILSFTDRKVKELIENASSGQNLNKAVFAINMHTKFEAIKFDHKKLESLLNKLLSFNEHETTINSIIKILNKFDSEERLQLINKILFEVATKGQNSLLAGIIAYYKPDLNIFDEEECSLLQRVVENEFFSTPLRLRSAKQQGLMSTVRILLENNASPDILSFRPDSYTASSNSQSITAVLITPEIKLPIFAAIQHRNLELFKLLCKHGADLTLYSKKYNMGVLECIITAGFEFSLYAKKYGIGMLESIKTWLELFEEFIKLARTNKDLLIQRSTNHHEALKDLLVQRPKNHHEASSPLATLIYFLTKIQYFEEEHKLALDAIKLFVDAAVDLGVNLTEKTDFMDLLIHIKNEHLLLALLEYLLDKSIEAKNNYFFPQSIFGLITMIGSLGKRVLFNKANELLALEPLGSRDFNSKDNPIMFFATQGQIDIQYLKSLLSNFKHEINTRNKDGQTALMFAVAANHIEAARELMANGASPHIISNAGITAYMLAHFMDRAEIKKIFASEEENSVSKASKEFIDIFNSVPSATASFMKESGNRILLNDASALTTLGRLINSDISLESVLNIISKDISAEQIARLKAIIQDIHNMQSTQASIELPVNHGKAGNSSDIKAFTVLMPEPNSTVHNVFAEMFKTIPNAIPKKLSQDSFIGSPGLMSSQASATYSSLPGMTRNSVINNDDWLNDPTIIKSLLRIGPLNHQRINQLLQEKGVPPIKAIKYIYDLPDGGKGEYIEYFLPEAKGASSKRLTYYDVLKTIFTNLKFNPLEVIHNNEVIAYNNVPMGSTFLIFDNGSFRIATEQEQREFSVESNSNTVKTDNYSDIANDVTANRILDPLLGVLPNSLNLGIS